MKARRYHKILSGAKTVDIDLGPVSSVGGTINCPPPIIFVVPKYAIPPPRVVVATLGMALAWAGIAGENEVICVQLPAPPVEALHNWAAPLAGTLLVAA